MSLVPISDMPATTSYFGLSQHTGQLYDAFGSDPASNHPPSQHRTDSLNEACQIVPRDELGAPSSSGLIGFLSVGISNITHEFGRFTQLANADDRREARVVLLNGGRGSIDSAIMSDPSADYWTWLDQRVVAAGMTDQQVQVAWLETGRICMPEKLHGESNAQWFERRIDVVRGEMESIVRILRDKYPNLRICYVSSRSFAGYKITGATQVGEPYSYESGFAVKEMIMNQIGGDPTLDFATGEAPLLLWGPYFWANGVTDPLSTGTPGTTLTTNDYLMSDVYGSKLVWEDCACTTCLNCDICTDGDVEPDRVHPSPAGEEKVSMLMEYFLENEPTADWYWHKPLNLHPPCGVPFQPRKPVAIVPIHDTYVDEFDLGAVFGTSPTLEFGPGRTVFVKFDFRPYLGQFTRARLSLRRDKRCTSNNRSRLFLVGNRWGENQLTYTKMLMDPLLIPSVVIATTPVQSKDASLLFDVTTETLQKTGGVISFAVQDPDQTDTGAFKSKELSSQSVGFPAPFTDPPLLILDMVVQEPPFEDPPNAPL